MTMNNNSNILKLAIKPDIFWVFSVQSLFCLNDSLFKNAFIILLTYKMLSIADLTSESLIAIGTALFIFPMLIASPFCAQIAEKYSKPLLIQYCKLFEIATASVAFIAFSINSVILMFIVLFMLGLQSALFVTVKLSMIPKIAQPNEFVAVNGLFDAGLFVCSIVGTLIGGMTILLTNGIWLVSGLLLFISILSYICSLKIPSIPANNRQQILDWHLGRKLGGLVRNVRGNHLAITALLGIGWFWFIATIFLMQTPSFLKNHLHMNSKIATFYITLFSVGIALGAIICEKLRTAVVEFRTAIAGGFGLSLFIVALVFTPAPMQMTDTFFHLFHNFYTCLSMLWVILIGVFSGFYMVPMYALLHHAEKNKHEALFALNNIVYLSFAISSALISTILIELGCRISTIFLIVSLTNLIVLTILIVLKTGFLTRKKIAYFYRQLARNLCISPYNWHYSIRLPFYFISPSRKNHTHMPTSAKQYHTNLTSRLKLVFAGDIMQLNGDNAPIISREMQAVIAKANYFIANCEAPLVNKACHNKAKRLWNFAMPIDYLGAIIEQLPIANHQCILSVANNHSCDQLPQVFHEGLLLAKQRLGIQLLGDITDNKEPYLIIEHNNNQRFIISAWTHLMNAGRFSHQLVYRYDQIATIDWHVLKKASNTNLLIGLPHWGHEYQHFPQLKTRQIANNLWHSGFDILIGSHPHVIQPLEQWDDKICCYSMGNFCSTDRSIYTKLIPLFEIDLSSDGRISHYQMHFFAQLQKNGATHLVPFAQLSNQQRLQRVINKIYH